MNAKAEDGGFCCNRGEAPNNPVPCAPPAAGKSLDEAMQAKDAVTDAERLMGSRVVQECDLDGDGMLNQYEFNWMVTLCGGLPMNAASFTTLSGRLGATGAGPSLEQSLKAFKFQYSSQAKFSAAVKSFSDVKAQLDHIFDLCNMKQDGLMSYREFCWMRSASGGGASPTLLMSIDRRPRASPTLLMSIDRRLWLHELQEFVSTIGLQVRLGLRKTSSTV